ncbi:MAG: 4Fe-4S binding protein [Lentisphaerae bacterium]|nr:4Fe-4S binding protein [Lentisphaerota bacterium]
MRWNWYRPPPPRRRSLRHRVPALGAGWATSPWRKATQTLCLLAFGALVFHVLRPEARDAAAAFERREIVEAEAFLLLDPLVGTTAVLASRAWHVSLAWAAAVLAACLVVPRLFCGYLCPLGTLIDLADWAAGRHLRRFHLPAWGGWTRIRYAVLVAIAAAAAAGTMLAGFAAPIPVLTRGLAFVLGPLQSRLMNGADAGNAAFAGTAAGAAILAFTLAATVLGPRFWCRVLCPTGALLSLAGRAGFLRRRTTERCTHCGECESVCTFGAIRDDHTTRDTECTTCQQCGGACPAGAIDFVIGAGAAPAPSPPAAEGLSRRALLVGAATGLLGGLGASRAAAPGAAGAVEPPLRPPGSLPEPAFLAACVRCASCIKGCPTGVLVPTAPGHGFHSLWTPRFDADRAGCAPDCAICGQACPTGAIAPLPLEEKRRVRVGLAAVDIETCLPHAGKQDCRLCVDACKAAGYDAIEFILTGVEMDASGAPVEDTGRLAPSVIADRWGGCGLCQAICHRINVREAPTLAASAIVVRAGGQRMK